MNYFKKNIKKTLINCIELFILLMNVYNYIYKTHTYLRYVDVIMLINLNLNYKLN